VERRVERKHLIGCPQVAFAACPSPFLTETKSYGETEETGHLQTQKHHLNANKTDKSPAEGAPIIPELGSFV